MLSILLTRTEMMQQREASFVLSKRAGFQKAAGLRAPSTTKLDDRRGYGPEKAESSIATY